MRRKVMSNTFRIQRTHLNFMYEESLTVTSFDREVLSSSLDRPRGHGMTAEMLFFIRKLCAFSKVYVTQFRYEQRYF